jgi:fused signal recognition particle receptor
MGIFGFFSKEKKESLDQGLQKTSESIFSKLSKAVVGKSKVDEEVLDELEEVLIGSDLGVETTVKVIQRIEERVARDKYLNASELDSILREEIALLLEENNTQDLLDFDLPAEKKPYVILVVGVNGVGKTTTIGKLAHLFKNAGKSVVLGAADTFRAAAVDQLILWGDRVGEARSGYASRPSDYRYRWSTTHQGQLDERAHQDQARDAKIYPRCAA